MAYYRSGNTAPAEQTPPAEQPEYGPAYEAKIEMKKNTSPRAPMIRITLSLIVVFALLGVLIYSRVEQLNLNNQITAKQHEYSDLQADNVRMQSEIAGRTSSKKIQEYAEDVLNMHPIDVSQIEYVRIQTDDVVEIPEAEQNLFVRVKLWFDNFVEYMRG